MSVFCFFFVFSSPLFAQQAAQTNVNLPPSVVSQALDVFDASKSPKTLTGKVTAVSGSVRLRNVKTIFWDELKTGQEVREGDNIKTGKDGQVKIEFANGNILFLKANSQIMIKSLHRDDESGKYEAVFKTNKARLKAEVNDREHLKTFEVHTPVVVAGARGTIFYVNVAPNFSEVFVERGAVSVRHIISGQEREVTPGLVSRADRTGKVTEPKVPLAEKLQEFQAPWEPLPPPLPPPGAPAPPPPDGGYIPPPPPLIPPDSLQETDQQFQDALRDKTTSQFADKTNYIQNPPPPSGDSDLDWLNDADEINLFHTSVTLPDTDDDGLTDWEEARAQKTGPLAQDSDSDSVDDRLDAFPNDPLIYLESRDPIRQHRYALVGGVAGLRPEINAMLADAAERQKDYLMDRISDAQIHKVLRDGSGNWVRMEEYVFRPAPNKVSVMSLASRTSAQLTSMYWETTFERSLDALTSQQIKNLPWEIYLNPSPHYGATAPINFPIKMTVKFERYLSPNNFLVVERTYDQPHFASGGFTQMSMERVSGRSGGTDFLPTAFTIPPGTVVPGNPVGFEYRWGVNPDQFADFNIHVIDETGTHAAGPFAFDSLWTVLGANLPGFTYIGSNTYLDIRVSFNGNQWDIIYIPIRRLMWRGTPEWEPQLHW